MKLKTMVATVLISVLCGYLMLFPSSAAQGVTAMAETLQNAANRVAAFVGSVLW